MQNIKSETRFATNGVIYKLNLFSYIYIWLVLSAIANDMLLL